MGARMVCAAGVCLALVGCGSKPHGRAPAKPTQPIKVEVSEPVIVLSILERLAGVPPYSDDHSAYARTVDSIFAGFGDDPAVRATILLAGRHGISYDAPMGLAAYLDEGLQTTASLNPLPRDLDDRWAHVNIPRYLTLVRRFAVAADVSGFRRRHRDYFDGLVRRYRGFVADQTIVPFYDRLFGPRPGTVYRLVPALLSAGYSFGVSAKRTRLVEPMVAPTPPPRMSYLAHEIAHSYVNDLLDPRKRDFRATAAPLYHRVEKAMRKQAYTEVQIMVDESVVRAVTILYLRHAGDTAAADAAAATDRDQGFAWTNTLADRLAKVHHRLDADTLIARVNAEFAAQLADG